MEIKSIQFSYDSTAISEEQFNAHLTLYSGYVVKSNTIYEKLSKNDNLSSANATYSIYRGLKKSETFALNGVILHEEYFRSMTRAKTKLGKLAIELFNSSFIDYENFIANFKATALSARGWCILTYEQRSQSFRILLQDSHDDGPIILAYPIIVLDMYEHAYFLDYQTDKEKYIDAFISSIDWNVVERRLLKLYAGRKIEI